MKIMKNLEELKAEKLEIEEKLENIEKEIKNQIEFQTFSKFEEDKYYKIHFGTTIWYFKFKKEFCTLDTYSKNVIIKKLIVNTFSLASNKYIISNNEFISLCNLSKSKIKEISEEEFNEIKKEVSERLSEI